jgi:hypothetical protein
MLDQRDESSPASGCDYTRRVVVCGSMAFYGQMCQLQETLSRHSVRAVVPDAESHVTATLTRQQYDAFKREVSLAHIRRIRNPLTFGILVANLDKHGIHGYVGPSTFAEIAIAAVHGKRVFLLDSYPDTYAEELAAWGAVALKGRLEPLIALYREICARSTRQFSMFATI